MSTNWMKVERALGRADRRLARRLIALAWLIDYHRAKWAGLIGIGRKWTRSSIENSGYPGWYDHKLNWIHYDEVMFLAMEAETLVLRLRALKYYGSTAYLDLQHISTLAVRDFLKSKRDTPKSPINH